jgi:hypothetical protein
MNTEEQALEIPVDGWLRTDELVPLEVGWRSLF